MAAAIKAVDIMENDPSMFSKLKKNSILMQTLLESKLPADLRVFSHPESVVKHVRLAVPSGDKANDDILLDKIVSEVNIFLK
jgi:hypothetical protein